LDGSTVNTYPDKGTFNYANGNAFNSIGNGTHKRWDMDPYDELMDSKGIETEKKYRPFGKNSDYC